MDVTQAISVTRLSDVGLLREHNEDAVASDLSVGLVLLADGMGGYRAGEVASEIAVLNIAAEVKEAMLGETNHAKPKAKRIREAEILTRAVQRTNMAIYQISHHYPQCAGMGTTLVAGLFADNKLIVGHIGDSRMYRLRGGELTQLTVDHSLVQEQLSLGAITEEQAKNSSKKNLVTRALGIDLHVKLDLQEYQTEVGDQYLLCSDGLTDLVSDEEIGSAMLEAGASLRKSAASLVRLANSKGGTDNISVVIAKVNQAYPLKRRWVKTLLGRD